MPQILVENLEKSYNGRKILDRISFQIEKGEVVGFLGPNGAGKSTTVKILTGQEKRDKGKVKVLNEDPEEKPVKVRAWSGILPERQQPPAYLKVSEYLDYVSDIRGKDLDKKKWLEEMRLEGKEDELIKNLSKGDQQKLIFIQAVFHNPEILFVDEPMINLDPFIQNNIKNNLLKYSENGTTIFLSTHMLSIAKELCDRVLILNEGKLKEINDLDKLEEEFEE